MAKVAVIGHVAIDRIIDHSGERLQLGGPPTYISAALGVLGESMVPVTVVGDDIPDDFLREIEGLGMDLDDQVAEGAETTRFVLDYTEPDRGLGVESVCENIGSESLMDLPDTALITPIIGELGDEALRAIDAEVLALDPQGFLREVQGDGSIVLQPWRDAGLIGRMDVMKTSREELSLITGEAAPRRGLERIRGMGAEIAVATLGIEGSMVSCGGRPFSVPAYESGCVDATGAGDVYLGAFMVEYLREEDPAWCACMGSSMASVAVETLGARFEASKREASRRAESLLERVERI